MINEDVLASGAMGFVLGLFAFIAGVVRVRYWVSRRRKATLSSTAAGGDPRYAPGPVAPSSGGGLRMVLDQVLAFDRFMDLLGVLFVIAMLLYGAWVAPRLRLILAVAVATALMSSFMWLKVARWLARR